MSALHDLVAGMATRLERIESEQAGIRTDVRRISSDVSTVRQEIGLSLPPQRSPQESAQRALFHLRAFVRYALAVGGGALIPYLTEWLNHLGR